MARPAYPSVQSHYAAKMMRLALSVGVVWGVASTCLAILLVTVFLQDQWMGDTPQSKGPGNFGLWRWCSDSHEDGARCRGDLASFSWSVPAAWRAATVFSLLGALLALLALVVWAASCCAATRALFRVAGLLQVGAGLAMTTVLTTYPAGWGASSVAAVCGDSASYRLGSCGLRWSYGLAVAATADCFLLGLLALSLAAKQRLALAEAEAGFLISNMEHAAPDTKAQVVLAQERPGPGVSRESLYTQNNFLL